MTPRPSLYADCMTCEEPFEPDELYVREPSIGAWHLDCGPPRNIALYRRERERGKPQRAYPPSGTSADSARA